MRVVGLMSGTSADGVDAALITVERVAERIHIETRAVTSLTYSDDVRAKILAACDSRTSSVDRICHLNALLGEWFARAALQVIGEAGLTPWQVDLIASHGQTIWHDTQPGANPPATLQIVEPAVIAERTGISVVANFRTRDVAAGGQGAPLISYVDYLLFHDPARARALQNIGGIANVTILPAGGTPDEVFAFDTGPGNMVVDALMRQLFDRRYDADGLVAASGRVDEALLDDLLGDEYFTRRPPKTTGREQYGEFYAARLAEAARARGLTPADAVATATLLTARSIALAYQQFLPSVDDLIVSGGGSANPVLLAWLIQELGRAGRDVTLRRPEDFGISADAKEAIGFAVLGYETLHGRVGTLPRCTGAGHPVVLGSITPGDNYRSLLDRVTAPRLVAAMPRPRFAELSTLVNDGVVAGVFPGAAVIVGRREDGAPATAYAAGFGRQTTDPDALPVDTDTIFDLASLTKVIATTTMAMILVDEGVLDLEAPVVSYLSAFGEAGKGEIRILDLLTHCSGLPAVFEGGFPAFATSRRLPRDRDTIIAAVCRQGLVFPTGSQMVYSDLGIIALGAVLEAIAGERLDHFVARRVFQPLAMNSTLFAPPPPLWPRCAPTERDYWRGRLVRGEVHDECAWMMGGIAPHAGLFSTARDLGTFGHLLLGKGAYQGTRIVSAETVERFVRRANRVPGSTRAIGWDTASPTSSSGPDLSPIAFGHTGFTGTSIWIDPAGGFFAVLLTNRVYPTRENTAILDFRPRFHSAVVAALRA